MHGATRHFRLVLLAASLAAAQTGAWTEGARIPTARSESRAAVIGSLVYFPAGFGNDGKGSTDLAAYDPAADKWTPLKAMPAGYDHPMVEAHGGRLYVFKTKTLEYVPGQDVWNEKTRGRHVRDDGTAVALGDYIYVIGGTGAIRPIERYKPSADTWEDLAPLPTLRGHVQAVVLDGKIWVLGGRAGNTMHKSVDIYDPAADKWSPGPEMNHVRSGFAAAAVGGRIVVAGGEILQGGTPAIVKSVEIYDPAAGRWVLAGDMPTPAHGTASAAFGGKLLVIGGSLKPFAIQNSDRVMIYEPPAAGTALRPAPGGAGASRRSGRPFPPGSAVASWEVPGSPARYVDALGSALRPGPYSGAR